ncbi:MAG: hypothetical protein NWE92_09940 [Candidatus Bathyarchaeota archaeon]|nr:hypothetical protein [Candidatus Bathyarchaeota archaeon]
MTKEEADCVLEKIINLSHCGTFSQNMFNGETKKMLRLVKDCREQRTFKSDFRSTKNLVVQNYLCQDSVLEVVMLKRHMRRLKAVASL